MNAIKVPIDERASEQLGREVIQGEYVPEDYFKRQTLSGIFSREAPTEIDLGCGDGSFLIQMAVQYPERNFLGVERLLGRVQKVCKKAYRAGLSNVKVLRLESLYAVEWLLPKEAFSRIHLICPDPWPKEKHHKHRIMQEPFFQAVHDLLTPDGEFLFRTDHEEYYEWAVERMKAFPSFHTIPWEEEDFFYPKSDFQLQWEAEGKCLYNLRCLKQGSF